MKYTTLENIADYTVRITQVRGLCIEPGKRKKVHPATVKHPAVSPYIPGILHVVVDEEVEDVSKEEPTAPEKTTPEPPPSVPEEPTEPEAPEVEAETEAPSGVEEAAETEVVEETEPVEDEPTAVETAQTEGEDSGQSAGDLREVYISAPGITDANVDAVLAAFPTVDLLAATTKNALVEVGVSKNQAKRVLTWAKSQ